jgi:protocatechuate 3,4-dioxygenase beta subunit
MKKCDFVEEPGWPTWTRRALIRSAASGILIAVSGSAFAEELLRTPRLTEGPFYPDKMPLDQDNDLIVVGKNTTPAVGEITHLRGRVLDRNGDPLQGATVEIWQCDAHQVYLHTSDSVPKSSQRDKNFQGYGKFETGSKGDYYFRTIKPVPYPGRPAPHIHVKVRKSGRELITTQIFVRGHEGNNKDGVFGGIRDVVDQELVTANFKPIKESRIGELGAKFDIVLGATPDERAFMPVERTRRWV